MVINDTDNVTPGNLRFGGDTLFFVNNVQQFLLVTVPLAVFTFVLLRLLKKKLPKVLAIVFRPFSWWSYLLVSMLCDNAQYLSFRSFEQLRYLAPTKGIIGYANIFILLLVGFLLVVGCCCMYALFWRYSRKQFSSDPLRVTGKSCLALTVGVAARIFNGFVHGYLDEPTIQLSCLLFVSVVNLVVACRIARLFLTKRSQWFVVAICLSKVLLGLLLMLEDEMAFDPSTFSNIEGEFSNLTTVVLGCCCLLMVMDYLVNKIGDGIKEIVLLIQSCKTTTTRVRHPKKILKMKKKVEFGEEKVANTRRQRLVKPCTARYVKPLGIVYTQRDCRSEIG